MVKEPKKGVMHARQKGYTESQGDIVAFVDADNVVPSGWIQKIEQSFAEDPSLAFICGPYRYGDLSAWQNALAKIYWSALVWLVWKALGYVGNFGNMAIRRCVLEKMGGLDTSISFYGDDTNTARRAAKFGKALYDLSLVVESSGRRFMKQGLLRTTFTYAINFFSQVIFRRSVSTTYTDYR